MADGQLKSNLFRTPLRAQQGINLILHPRCYRVGVAAQLPADGELVSIQQFGYLSLIVSSLHMGVILISFCLAEVFVIHKQLRLAAQQALNPNILSHLSIS